MTIYSSHDIPWKKILKLKKSIEIKAELSANWWKTTESNEADNGKKKINRSANKSSYGNKRHKNKGVMVWKKKKSSQLEQHPQHKGPSPSFQNNQLTGPSSYTGTSLCPSVHFWQSWRPTMPSGPCSPDNWSAAPYWPLLKTTAVRWESRSEAKGFISPVQFFFKYSPTLPPKLLSKCVDHGNGSTSGSARQNKANINNFQKRDDTIKM